jgi:hypothetical protein
MLVSLTDTTFRVLPEYVYNYDLSQQYLVSLRSVFTSAVPL